MHKEIRISAALVFRDDGDTLLVRKRGTHAFMQAGGKIEDTEGPKEALVRELKEELGLDIAADRMTPFGSYQAEAANEPGYIVNAYVFLIRLRDEVIAPAAEIEEARWIDVHNAASLPLAPLTRDRILPAFRQMQLSMELER